MDTLAELLGKSAPMEALRHQLHRILDRQRTGQRLPPILLEGETGTGKGLVARLLHRHGARSRAPFVDVNCAAIPETLFEAELFGFERGAFTDARRAKPGLFQAAHGGLLFLDEISLLPESSQAKLLTAIEERAVRRLGSTRAEPADAWLVSASNADLKAAVRARRFREDLYHRLAVVILVLPPLRERGTDILLLAERFLARACADYALPAKRLDAGAEARLLAYHWPGNIRELANVIERAALFAETPALTATCLGPLEAEAADAAQLPLPPAGARSRDEVLRQQLLAALEQTDWSISLTAARLGVARNTVYARLHKFRLRADGSRQVSAPFRPPAEPARSTRPVPESALEWERRSLALLRADLCDTGRVDGSALASRALDAVIAKVHSFGGRVEEVSPAGLVAAFGLEPVEDAPRSAAHAALAIQKEARRTRENGEAPADVTIGLHVAAVLIGRVGARIEIDVASKRESWPVLEQLVRAREPGETIASTAAAPFLERRFELAPVPRADDGPGPVYRVNGRERRGLELWDAMTPFVGRRDELEVLRARLNFAASGHGQVVAVVGEAGVGKSRLIHELAPTRRVEGWRVLEASGLPHGQAMLSLPVIDLLKSYFSVQERDDPRAIREKVTGRLFTLDRALEPTLPALLALLDVAQAAWQALEPPERRHRTFDAVRRLLLREAREQPLLLIIEDLHWIDSDTGTLLDALVDGLGSAPVFLLVSYRPEYRHRWDRKSYYSQLSLDALAPERARDFLDVLLGQNAGLEPLKQLLIKRGNAFFLEETTRTLVETQALAGERGGYRLTQPLQTLAIPPTVQAVIAARIDRLSSEDKRLLQITAVIGKATPVALLQAIAQIDEPALREGLARLQAGGFLDEVPASRGTAYVFKHALVYEVAYGGLLQERRRELHVRILDVLEAVHQDDPSDGQIERLAHHAIQGEVWEKAACLTQQAGLRAMLRSGYRQAVVCFEQALGALGHLHQGPETLAQAIDVHLQLRFALHALGELNRMGDEVEAALILAESSRDEPRIARVLSHLSQHYFLVGRLRDAVVAGERSVKVARAAGDTYTELQARFRMGLAYHDLGDFQRAVELLSSTLESLRRPSIDRGEYLSVYTRTWLAFSLAARGEFPDAVAHGEEAIRVAEMLDDGFCLGHAYLSLGVPYVLQGEWPDAIRLFEQTVKMVHDREILGLVPTSTAWLGFAYAMSGRSVEGLELLEPALATAESRGAQRLWRLMARLGSEARLRAGKPGAALEIARRGLELSRDQEGHVSEAWYTWQLARITASQEPPDLGNSEHGYRKALALAHDLGMRPLVAHCHLGLAELCRRAAKGELAREHLATATSMYRDMGMRFWLQQAETHSVP